MGNGTSGIQIVNNDASMVSDNTDTPIYDGLVNGSVPEEVNWTATVRKAFIGAAIGAATSLTGTLPTQLADGVFTTAELMFTLTVTIGAVVVGFAAVWRVPNKG